MQTLSTPSLGITDLARIGNWDKGLGIAFNSLSRDHWTVHFLKWDISFSPEYFQLPLSGSLKKRTAEDGWEVIFELSTPSLGITFGSSQTISLRLLHFQLPLSGSRGAWLIYACNSCAGFSFNSLSRDHSSWWTRRYFRASTLSTPSLGITRGQEDCRN
mgnify:CR=1 FL=1